MELKHIGVILDGNRRFAKRLMKEPSKGHEYGARKVVEFLKWCKDSGIKEVTFYAFSKENYNRPKKEFDLLMKILEEHLDRILGEKDFYGSDVKVNVAGDLSGFPAGVRKKLSSVVEATKDKKKYVVNLCLGYGGRDEIVNAARNIAREVREGKISEKDIDERLFASNLWIKGEPDLIIRTGGEVRTSNFLPWQSAYSEWIFYKEKMWPEFEKEDFDKCIKEFKSRKRRFGR